MKNKIDPIEIMTPYYESKENWFDKASPWIAALALFLALFGGWIVDYFTK